MKTKPRLVTDIWTHPYPHPDEIAAILIVQEYGGQLFPGAADARIHFTRCEGDATGQASDSANLLDHGVLNLGTGQGPFDEHSADGVNRNECCATLVAKYLGVRNNPELRQLLDYILAHDRKGTSTPFDFAQILRALYFKYGDDQETAFNEALALLKSAWSEQYDFHVVAADEFKNKADRRKVSRGSKELRVAMINSDHPRVAVRALYEGADIVVIHQSDGHNQILLNKKTCAGISLADVVKVLRYEEQLLIKPETFVSDWNELGRAGMLLNWYYQDEGPHQVVMNGSRTAPDVTPSSLSGGDIFFAIEAGLTDTFHQDCTLARNFCDKRCPAYVYGLGRCRGSRKELACRKQAG